MKKLIGIIWVWAGVETVVAGIMFLFALILAALSPDHPRHYELCAYAVFFLLSGAAWGLFWLLVDFGHDLVERSESTN